MDRALPPLIKLAKEMAAEGGTEVMLVAQHTSRFARGDCARPDAPKALVELWHEWQRSKVRGRLVENDMAMSSSVAAAVQGDADHSESARKSKSTRKGLRRRARDRGMPHGGAPPYGYDTGDDGEWIVRESEVELINRIFRMRVEGGLSYHGIARTLNAEGIPTRKGRRWAAVQIRHMIEGRHVRGYFYSAGEWRKGSHPAIVTDEHWTTAQAMIGRDAKYTGSRQGRTPKRHLFTHGLLRCSACGGPMLTRSGATSDADRYVCATSRMDSSACPNGAHYRADLDARFLALFEREFLDFDATRDRMATELDRSLALVNEQLASAESEVARIEDQQQRVEADYLAQELGAAAYERLSAKLEAQQGAAIAERDRLAAHAEDVRQSRLRIDAESETLRRLAAIRDTVASHARDAVAQDDLEALRGLIAAAIEHIYLRPDGTIARMTPGVRLQARTEGLHSFAMLAEHDGEFVPVPRFIEDGAAQGRAVRVAAQGP